MRPRTRNLLLAATLVLCAIAAFLYLCAKAPPEIARLLPESDAIVFVNLKPLRTATHFDRTPVTRSPSLQQFIDATGIVFERDLDSAAFALHRMPNPSGPNGPVAFSEIFRGSFDSTRLTRYLAATSVQQESYAGSTIYSIPSENRILRVTELDSHTIAASNTPSPEQIHAILDHHRIASNPFQGPTLLNLRFRDVPVLASAWAIGQLALPFAENGRLSAFGLTLPIPADSTFVASLRFTGALHLRIEQLASSNAEAAQSAQALTGLLNLFRGLQLTQQSLARTPADAALREALNSVVIEARQDRAVLTATLPTQMFSQLKIP